MILEIIEEKPNYSIPLQIYKLIILLFFLQLLGYCMTNQESKKFDDEKIGSVSRANEVASLTYILFMKGNDLVTIVFFIVVQTTVYSYFIYVALLSFLKNKKRYLYIQYQGFFKGINQVLNTYFTLYDWIFFIPIMETNYGMIFCGNSSFLLDNREENCTIQIQYKIVGYIGLFLGLSTSFITSFFFRNYEFDEQNKLKRRFNLILSIQTILKSCLSLVYFLSNKYTDSFKFVLTIIIAITCMYDSVWNIPFRDKQLLRFYSACASYYFCISILCTIWIFGDNKIEGHELFYYIILFGIVCKGLVQVLIDCRLDSIIKGNWYSKEKNHNLFGMIDILLEQIMKLALQSTHSEQSKYQLIEILKIHNQNCNDTSCICKNSERNVIIKKVRVDINYVCDLINCIFIFTLKQKDMLNNRTEMEHLTLKYISFLYKYYGNSPRAYFELKLYLSKKIKTSSYYFAMISKVISNQIENQIDVRRAGQSDSNKGSNQLSQRNQELTVYTIVTIDAICERFIPIIINSIQYKIEFWENLLLGSNTLDDLQTKCLSLMKKIQHITNQFNFKMKQINNFVQQYDSFQLKKLRQMFYLLVLNDTMKAQKLEEEGEELRSRDMLKNAELINTTNLMKGNLQTVIVSLSKNIGKITSKKDKKFLSFFGYDKEDGDQIHKINELMPGYISRQHDQFLKHYIKKGKSNLIQKNFTSFIRRKEGFIQQAKIYLDYIFQSDDDFQMVGTILKTGQANDYLIFNRSGVIVGITQNLFEKIFSQNKNIPNPGLIINKYFTFLFFNEILKTFKAKKDEFLQSVEKGETNIQLDLSRKGFFDLNESYDESQQQLQNYIDYCKKNPNEIQSYVESDKLDLLEDQTLEFLEKFQAFKLLSKNLGGGKKSSNQSLSSRVLKNKLQYSNESKSLKMYKIRLFFKYTLHLTQFDLTRNSTDSSKKDAYFVLKFHDLTINKKSVGQKAQFTKSMITYLGATTSIGLMSQFGTQFSGRFPTLQFQNSKDFQNLKQSINSNQSNPSFNKFKEIPIKMISSFVKLKSTVSLKQHSDNEFKFQQQLENEQIPSDKNLPLLKQTTSQENKIINQDHKYVDQSKANTNQNKENINTKRAIMRNDLENQEMDNKNQQTKSKLKEIMNSNKKMTEKEKNKTENEKSVNKIQKEEQQSNLIRKQSMKNKQYDKIDTSHNYDNEEEDTKDFEGEEDDDEDIYTIDDVETQKLKNKQVDQLLQNMNIDNEYNNTATKQLTDQILQKYTMNENYVKAIDPNYQFKKILQSNTRSSQFSIALENAILEAQMEMMQEKKVLDAVKSLISPQEDSSLLNQQDQQLVTPSTHRLETQNIYFPSSVIKNDSSNSLLKLDSTINSNSNQKQGSLQKQNSNLSKSKDIQYDLNNKDQIKSSDSNKILKVSSKDFSPIHKPVQVTNKAAPQRKSQFLQNNSQQFTNDSVIKSFINQNDTSQLTDENTPKPHFQNPDELVYTFRESMHRVNTPSVQETEQQIDNESEVSSSEQKDRVSTRKSLRKTLNENDYERNVSYKNEWKNQDSTVDDDQNMEFKFQKSLEQEEDIDGQLEEIKTQKQKKVKSKKITKSVYSQRMSIKNRTHHSLSQYNIQINLLKEKGLRDEENNLQILQGSVNSSTSSTRTRYGGFFLKGFQQINLLIFIQLKEILNSKRIPLAAHQYQLLLFLFCSCFIALNIINLNIIQTSMNDFRNYVQIIRVPRQFQRQYSIAFIGEYTKFKLKYGYLTDTVDKKFKNLTESYKKKSYNAYNDQYTNNSQLVSESWESIQNSDFYQQNFINYQDQQPSDENVRLNMIYMKVLTKLLLLQENQTQIQQRDSFLFLRKNYLQFSEDVTFQVDTLVNSVKDTVDKLTSSFTTTTLSAIISLLLVGILFFPLVYWTNKYQEQILMIVSRVYKEQAEIERNKYSIIKQLIDYEKWDWLRYSYNDILWMKYDYFDLSNQKHKNTSRNFIDSSHGNTNKKSQNLQSLIFVQKLSIFKKIWILQLIILISVIYFSFIIVYIYTQNSILKFPVVQNFNTFSTHINFNKLKVCEDIVAFDRYLAQQLPGYDISDIEDFRTCIYSSMDKLNSLMELNQAMIYDDSNPLPDLNRQTGKNLFEGNICSIVTSNPCKEGDLTNTFGMSQIYSMKQKCLITFPSIFNYTKDTPLNDNAVKNYFNDDCSKVFTIQSFMREDEVIHLFSSNINASISTISNDISDFLSSYLTILGVILSILICLFSLINWFLIKRRLLLMNLVLILIPEEKLSEEIILNMLKNLRYS